MFSKKLLDELEIILKEEFDLVMTRKELEKFARNLVGYFDLVARFYHRKEENG